MAWTTPRTWVAGELVTAAIMNTHVRDNLNILTVAISDDGQTWSGTGSVTAIGTSSVIRLVDAASPTRGISFDIGTAGLAKLVSLGSDVLTMRSNGQDTVKIGSVGSFATRSLVIDQGANDDTCFGARSSDVAHGFTTHQDTDIYFDILKHTGAAGGAMLRGYTDDVVGMALVAATNSSAQDKSGSATGAILLNAAGRSGTDFAALAANSNIVMIRNNGTTVAIFDADGDISLDGAANDNVFDDHDDVALLAAVRGVMTGREMFARVLDEARPVLAAARVVQFNDDGHHFVSIKGIIGLTLDAIRQEAVKTRALVAALDGESRARYLAAIGAPRELRG